jgi:hypothetical protein
MCLEDSLPPHTFAVVPVPKPETVQADAVAMNQLTTVVGVPRMKGHHVLFLVPVVVLPGQATDRT